jgi:hypothetical protein
MSSTKSVSILILDVRTGDADARHFPQLVQLARQKLGAGLGCAIDMEDAALSAQRRNEGRQNRRAPAAHAVSQVEQLVERTDSELRGPDD